ncbi:MAG: glycosyltransferase family 2 protein [Bacteroidales bacterium]|nr:glycosyltransferase family 2 protein [Bacteroidales bacterium]
MEISIVSPIYKGEKMLDELVSRITNAVKPITEDYEIILVNDCSPDQSWHEIERKCAQDKHVKGIDLSRNFGQHYAISAGLANCVGKWVVVMDCDLQDRPEEIPNLYAKAQEGWEIVYARRVDRQDNKLKKMQSAIFHDVLDWLMGTKTDKTITNFGIYKKCVIDAFNKMPEKARSFGSLVWYLGFSNTAIDVQHAQRAEGTTGYTLRKLLKLSFDIIISNSNKPLRLTVGLGFLMSIVSFLLAFYNVIARSVGLITVEGYTTTIFSIWFVGGLLLFVMGILGLYIGMIFDQVKDRPLYVIRTKKNFDED